MMRYASLLFVFAVAGCATVQPASAPSPSVPDVGREPIAEPGVFARAVTRGTRTRTGQPGPRYWQQYAKYRIEAEIVPATRTLTGRETVWYFNRSPNALPELWVYLNQNLFAPNAVRNEEVPVTGGMTLTRVAAGGRALTQNAQTLGYMVDGTRMRLRPTVALPPGDSLALEFEWSFVIPPDGAPRSGVTGDTASGVAMMVAYWYPQLAVYDDVSGWVTDPYMGRSEFYMGYADYDVSLTLPAGWVVGGTGVLQNPAEVLTPAARERLAEARRTGNVVQVLTEADRGPGRATAGTRTSKLTWRYLASNVRDFSFGAGDRYLWDATIAIVGDRNGDSQPDTADIHTLYRPMTRRWAWGNSAQYSRHSIEFLSRYLWPYPYPHMLALDGPVSCSGMEYPMMTCIGGPRDTLSLYSVTVHEFAHMWFPMQVGSDERRYAWQDEGLTRFNQAQGMRDFFKGLDREAQSRQNYFAIARTDDERPLMVWGDLYPYGTAAYGIASYDKMATNLRSLRALLGEDLFMQAYREYGRRWVNRHPTPQDFFNTFENVAGRDLDWFWRAWWYETSTLDQGFGGVTTEGDRLRVTIENRGRAPMPVFLVVTRTDGTTSRITVPVEVWLSDARQTTVTLEGAGTVRRMEIDPEQSFPDIDRRNNVWARP